MARYYHVVANMSMELVKAMGDILAASPSDGAYDRFKAATLRSTTEFESSRLRQLLYVEELGPASDSNAPPHAAAT